MTGHRGGRRRAALLVALCIVSACGPATTPTGGPGAATDAPVASTPDAIGAATAPPLPPATAWSRALADIDDEGGFSLEAALTLFATAYGPLPGVDVRQDLAGVSDRTVAINAVMAHRDELTTAQRAAVDAALAIPDDAEVVTIPPIGTARSHVTLAELTKDQQELLRGSAAQFRERIASLLGRDFLGDLNLAFLSGPDPETPTADADSWSDWPGGVFGNCNIRLFAGFAASLPQVRDLTLAHEVFHCFQHDAYRTIEAESAVPRWVIEGQAEWAAATLIDFPDDWWIAYLQEPTTPLTKRSYDAIGFYAHLAETGTDPWSVFQDMWLAGTDNAALYTAARATTDAFLDSAASGIVLLPNLGSAWTTGGAGMVGTEWGYRSTPDTGLGNGGRLTFSAPRFTSTIKTLNVSADMVHISGSGHARLADGEIDATALEDAWYCVAGHKCESECPMEGPAIVLRGTVNSRFLLALAGGLSGTTVTLEGVKFDGKEPPCDTPSPTEDFCTKYRAYVAWATALGEDTDITQSLAAAVARRFDDMYPVAPAELKDWVTLVYTIYATFAGNPEPISIPITGNVAGIDRLPQALRAMHAYCGIPWTFGD